MLLRSRPVLLAPFLFLAAPVAAQSVWTVDADGPADFRELQAAIDAAADGDAILVAPGGYAPIRVLGKGVRIHGPGAAILNAPVAGVEAEAVLVADLPAASAFVLEGFQVVSFLAGSPSVVHVRDCEGPVWLSSMFVDAYGAPALHVERSPSVVMDRGLMQTNLTAPTALGEPQPGPGAMVEGGSRLFAYDTSFRGSHGPFVFGGIPPVAAPQDGGHGLVIVDSEAHLTGGAAYGGTGSTFSVSGCLHAGDGGSGIVLVGAGGAPPFVRIVGTALVGASAGFAEPCAPAALPGVDLDPGPGTAVVVDEHPRLVAFGAGAVAPGESLSLVAHGLPGDVLVLFASAGPMPAVSLGGGPPLWLLHLLVQPAPLVPLAAVVLAGPTLGVSFPAPPLPPGVTLTAALQAVLVPPVGFPQSSAPLAVTIHQP